MAMTFSLLTGAGTDLPACGSRAPGVDADDCRNGSNGPALDAIRAACEIFSAIAIWRNDRVHARVRLTEDGYVLYDWRTRRRLELTVEEVQKNVDMAARAMVNLDVHVSHLLHELEWEEEFERLFSTLPELSPHIGEDREESVGA